jgi:glutamyl-tRNA synthetase
LAAEGNGHNPLVSADGRFAPSPTGTLHVGNLRTALVAWLFARSQDARYLVRMEDLDTGRVRERFYDEQLHDLAALGLDWDGPVVRQSERMRLYEAALQQLRQQDLIYECWCTRAEIREAASAPHGELPEGAYPGTCRELTAAERAERQASGRPPALRVDAGAARIAFEDRLAGHVEGVVDDFVVRRNDGAFAYNLAVVVDDGAQSIGEVVRGADLLDSTPRQLWLGAQLGIPAPRHAHVVLMLGPDGARLAKRHGAVTLADRGALGQSADDVRDELAASLQLCARGESLTPAELVERFSAATLRQAA